MSLMVFWPLQILRLRHLDFGRADAEFPALRLKDLISVSIVRSHRAPWSLECKWDKHPAPRCFALIIGDYGITVPPDSAFYGCGCGGQASPKPQKISINWLTHLLGFGLDSYSDIFLPTEDLRHDQIKWNYESFSNGSFFVTDIPPVFVIFEKKRDWMRSSFFFSKCQVPSSRCQFFNLYLIEIFVDECDRGIHTWGYTHVRTTSYSSRTRRSTKYFEWERALAWAHSNGPAKTSRWHSY